VDSVAKSSLVEESNISLSLDVDPSMNCNMFRAYVGLWGLDFEVPNSVDTNAICFAYIKRSNNFSRLNRSLCFFLNALDNINPSLQTQTIQGQIHKTLKA